MNASWAIAVGMGYLLLILFNLVLVVAFYPHYFKPVIDSLMRKYRLLKMIKEIENQYRFN